MKKKIPILISYFIVTWLCVSPLNAQLIAIDRGVRVEGLWCFPLVTDSLQYLFLPDQSSLALDKQKNPQFSFIRYVNNLFSQADTNSGSIRSAQGGGILHFLVTYDTEESKIANARNKLKELLGNDKVNLKGPIIFTEGRFAMVSSVLNPENGRTEKQVLATGAAPVLEGSRIALSFEMDQHRSKLLLESFKMSTPDISLVFDLSFAGLTDAYNATLSVDWSEVQKYKKTGAGGSLFFLSADVEKMYQSLERKNAINLQTNGSNEKMEALVANVYAKLTELIFKEQEPEQAANSEKEGLSNLVNTIFQRAIPNNTSTGILSGLSAHAVYKRKEIANTGSSVLHFNSRLSSVRHHYISFNISNIYKKYGENTDYFKTVSLSDPDFERRDIFVGVDGTILPEFDKLINSVTVTLRKQHKRGTTTVREVNVTKSSLENPRFLMLSYDAVGDSNRVEWLDYEYKTQFMFKGGKKFEIPWEKNSASMINIFTPYERKTIRFDGDSKLLEEKNVRAVIIQVEYPFFGETRKIETYMKAGDNIQDKQFDVTLPLNELHYRYTLKWKFKDGTEKTFSGENDNELLFVDQIPEN